MTSENNGMMYMPVAPAYGAGNAGGMGFDGFGGGWGLLLLLAILGWGNGGYSGHWPPPYMPYSYMDDRSGRRYY